MKPSFGTAGVVKVKVNSIILPVFVKSLFLLTSVFMYLIALVSERVFFYLLAGADPILLTFLKVAWFLMN